MKGNMNKIHAIIFDMDGVIADSEPLHFQAEQVILKQRGIEAAWSEWSQFTGLPDHIIFQHIVDNFTDGTYSVNELLDAKYQIFLKLLAEKLQPVPGSLDFIRWARDHYEKLALTTSSIKEIQETIFNIFDLHAYFDVIVTGDQLHHNKPHPEPYLKTVSSLNLSAHNCFVLEDSINGIKSAKSAGCYVAGITTSFPEDQLQHAGADLVVDNFSSLYHQLPFNNNHQHRNYILSSLDSGL